MQLDHRRFGDVVVKLLGESPGGQVAPSAGSATAPADDSACAGGPVPEEEPFLVRMSDEHAAALCLDSSGRPNWRAIPRRDRSRISLTEDRGRPSNALPAGPHRRRDGTGPG
jgi:hypothetical protein